MTDRSNTGSLPLSFMAEQVVAGMLRRLGVEGDHEFGLHRCVLDLLEHHRAVAAEVGGELDLDGMEAAARRKVDAGDSGRPIDRAWLVARATSAAAAAGRSVITPGDVATPVLQAGRHTLTEREEIEPEPEEELEEPAPPPSIPLGFLAEQMLGALERAVGSAKGGRGSSSWLLALCQDHRDVVGKAADRPVGDLEAAARRRIEGAVSEGPLDRERVVAAAAERAQDAGRSAVTPADVAGAIVELAERAPSQTEPVAEPESVAEPEPIAELAPPQPEQELEGLDLKSVVVEAFASTSEPEPEPRPEPEPEPEQEPEVVVAEPVAPAAPIEEARTFRVFVSSTFSDLKAERNALQAQVFPRLRELCERHGARFQAIDLRWGVSQEASRDQQTMNICLGEIERCQEVTPRPNFIVLLGDRYGWCPPPPQIPANEFEGILEQVSMEERSLLEAWYRRDDNAVPPECVLQPWDDYTYEEWGKIERDLHAALEKGAEEAGLDGDARFKYWASATHQEIAAGALEVEDADDHVFAFFRQIHDLPEDDEAEGFIDLVEADEGMEPDTDASRRLDGLKADLREALGKSNVEKYDVEWTEDGPSTDPIGALPEDLDACLALLDAPQPPELCAAVWHRLARTILREIEHPTALPTRPEEVHVEVDEGLDAEGRTHCDFANGLLHHFVGRNEPLQTIRDYLTGDEPRSLTVVAAGGAGKSALVAKALEGAQEAHPDAQVVYRFIGATPSSSDGRSLLVNLCQEISRRYGEDDEEVPYDYTDLVPELGKRMAAATVDQPLILFLDALDQLSEAHGARRLTWLPRRLPENVRVVVSTRREEDTFDAVMQHQPKEVALGPMSREDGAELLDLWLDDADRALTSEQRKAVLDAFEHEDSGGRPLYLKLAFEEARLWPSYAPPEPPEPGIEGVIRENLFRRLSREKNHGQELVARTVGYLAASRYGLAEDELLDLLSRDVDVYSWFLGTLFHTPPQLLPHAREYVESRAEIKESAEAWLQQLRKRSNETESERKDRERKLRDFVSAVLTQDSGLRLPVVLWSRLYFDLEPYLTRRRSEGTPLLAFYHRELDDVGRQEYAQNGRGRELHGRLADYFRFRADPSGDGTWDGGDPRGLSELPYHLTEAARWQEVFETLTDFRFLEHKAAEVGVEKPEDDDEGEFVYTGVLQLQEDYDRALRRMPGGSGAAGGRRPLIVTAVDLGDGLMVRCPWCNTQHPLTEERREAWLGEEIACPNEDCEGPLKVNPFVVEREGGNGR